MGSTPIRGIMDYLHFVPWTDEEVKSLNEHQACDYFHPFTHCDHQVLIATKDGWVCPKCSNCEQKWCHKWMADWSWKKSALESAKLCSDPRVQKLLAGQNDTEEKK